MSGARLPVIPENITVHLGPASSAAPNVTVPFSEYIKNVASSEIYPCLLYTSKISERHMKKGIAKMRYLFMYPVGKINNRSASRSPR